MALYVFCGKTVEVILVEFKLMSYGIGDRVWNLFTCTENAIDIKIKFWVEKINPWPRKIRSQAGGHSYKRQVHA